MTRSKLKPTIAESFAVGKLEGVRETLEEIQDLLKDGVQVTPLNSYVKARLKSLANSKINNPFKQKDSK